MASAKKSVTSDQCAPSRSERLTASTAERGAALYSCMRYWIVRALMPRISAAFDVEPPVDSSVLRIA